jgi:hypothetical protein
MCWSLSVFSVVVWVLIYAAPPIYASLWHLVHGSTIQCEGFLVPVPKNWWAANQRCTLTTASPEYTLGTHRPVELFLRDPIAAGDATWGSTVVTRLKQHGIAAYHSTNLSVGGIPTTCFEFRTPNSVDRSNIGCNVHRHMTIVLYYYDDDPKMKTKFYQMLATIRPAGHSR